MRYDPKIRLRQLRESAARHYQRLYAQIINAYPNLTPDELLVKMEAYPHFIHPTDEMREIEEAARLSLWREKTEGRLL